MARFLWAGIGEALGWSGRLESWEEDFLVTWISRECKMPKRFSFASLAWALWTTRNKMAIEHTFPNSAIQT